jgi:hypothetical protein
MNHQDRHQHERGNKSSTKGKYNTNMSANYDIINKIGNSLDDNTSAQLTLLQQQLKSTQFDQGNKTRQLQKDVSYF